MEAPSLQSIGVELGNFLQPHTIVQSVPVLDSTLKAVKVWDDPVELQWTSVRVTIDQVSKLAAILFCSPDSMFGKAEVIPFLDLFNDRSEDFFEMYCAGFSTEEVDAVATDGRLLPVVGGEKWWFSNKTFNSLRKEVEAITQWKFSGETDLILFTAHRNAQGKGGLSFSPSLACNLEQMARDSAFTSFRAFFEAMMRLGETYDGRDPVSQFSNVEGIKIGGSTLKNLVLTLLPKPLQEGYRRAEHFAVRDISR